MLYGMANARIVVHALQTAEPYPLRPTEMRGVAALATTAANESLLDELAAVAG